MRIFAISSCNLLLLLMYEVFFFLKFYLLSQLIISVVILLHSKARDVTIKVTNELERLLRNNGY